MSRIRLNQEYRNKGGHRFREHLEQEHTQEKEKFFQLRESFKAIQDKTWTLAKECVSRLYIPKDVQMAHYLQDKYPNVNTVEKDSCFHFGYMGKPEEKDEEDKYISKHFDFRLNGDIDGVDRQDDEQSYRPSSRDFGYAYFRDELKAQEGCNPDINIEMSGKDSNNPYQRKIVEANDKHLGMNCSGRDNATSYQKEWDKNYSMDLIGREYCRDRQLMTSKENYDQLIFWKSQKSAFVMAHETWVKSIMAQMKEVKLGLKGYKYLDEALELSTELGLDIKDVEIVQTNSTGLTIFNPKNLADRIKGMKNVKKQTIQEKVLARMEYERQANNLN